MIKSPVQSWRHRTNRALQQNTDQEEEHKAIHLRLLIEEPASSVLVKKQHLQCGEDWNKVSKPVKSSGQDENKYDGQMVFAEGHFAVQGP
ncbi:hypothetical protein A0H81_06104 [Grifola frondosa]|uniref:Uncharacterized protein n=1 Tax=Grifola frondosa TaxID=5627 RepID=A0A1C7MFS8_GRIFR|nr:hypothetical protein A0H81_06104 [Grifola frondosa]